MKAERAGFFRLFRLLRRKRLLSSVNKEPSDYSHYTTNLFDPQGFETILERRIYLFKAPYSIYVGDQKVANFAYIAHACLCLKTAIKEGTLMDANGTTINPQTIRDVCASSYPGLTV